MAQVTRARFTRYVAFSYLFVPFLNVFLSLWWARAHVASSGITVSPSLLSIGFFDWFCLGMIFIAGLALFKQHKTTWLYTTVIVVMVIALNLLSLVDADPLNPLHAAAPIQILFSIFLGFSIFVIVSYARYPYLDRRHGWVYDAAPRFDFATAARVIAEDVYECVTESVSATGCRVRLQKDWGPASRVHLVDIAFPDFQDTPLKAEVVGAEGVVLRLKFKDWTRVQKRGFEAWIATKGTRVT